MAESDGNEIIDLTKSPPEPDPAPAPPLRNLEVSVPAPGTSGAPPTIRPRVLFIAGGSLSVYVQVRNIISRLLFSRYNLLNDSSP